MRAARAFQLARRCFALAASTGFDGEREAAIARGIEIATAAGLSLDRFDIPGRARAAALGVEDEPEDLRATLARAEASLRTRLAEVGAVEGETIYDAQRRNFDAAIAAAKARDHARDNPPRLG